MFENISLPSLIYLGSLEEALLNIENSSSKFSLKYPLIVHCDCQCWNKGTVKKWKFRMAFAMKGGGSRLPWRYQMALNYKKQIDPI